MLSNFMKRRRVLKGANLLELTPIKKYEFEINEDELVTILVPKFTNKFLSDNLMPRLKKPHMRVKLDKFGSALWLIIDGNKTVSAVGESLVQKFGEDIQPVEERLSKFITVLYEQRFITFNELKKIGA